MKFTNSLLFVLLAPVFSFAQGYLYVPGSIPLNDHRPPATDVVYQGEVKTPDELLQLQKKGIDISALNPREDTSIWKDTVGSALRAEDDELGLNLNNPTDYLATLPSRTGVHRFTFRQGTAEGGSRVFRALISKNAHSYLLRKNLLRKLGYVVPPIQYVPRLTLNFKGEITKKDFIERMAAGTLGDPTRWIRSGQEEGATKLELQDFIIFSDEDTIYNLGTGYLSGAQHIRGRRVLNSLLIPYSLVNVQESVNGMSWTLGRVVNQFVVVDAENAEEFTPDKADAMWMLRRLSNLSRADYAEIVKNSHFPESVAKLLTEKLIARRNTILKKFNMLNNPLSIETKVTMAPELIEGELKLEWWEGHAARYAYPDPESPLSSAEIRGFFKSKAISATISGMVQRFDQEFLSGTDIEKRVIEKQIAAAKNEFINFLKTGVYKKTPLGFFAFPTMDGDISISRDIVTGEYLGSENIIQLADNLDFSVAPGVFVGAVGLPTNVSFQAGAQLRFGRSYTHLKPIKSIRRALKEPYRNMLVTLVKKEHGRIFDELLSEEYLNLDSDDKKKEKIKELMEVFNETMATGDSFIISDNISGDVYAGLGYKLVDNLVAQASLYHSKISVGRLHIVKPTNDSIHIYKDKGDMAITGVELSVEAYLPIVSIRFSKTKGKAKTEFYSLDINPNTLTVPELEKNLTSLRQVLAENSLELLRRNQKPFQVHHNFREKVTGFSFLFFDQMSVANFDRIHVTHPEGGERAFLKQTMGTQQGNDYQGLTIDAINAVFEEQFETEYEFPNPGSGDPGDTFKGKSNMRKSSLEVEINPATGEQIDAPFFNLTYRWKGWKLKDKKMQKLVGDVNAKFGTELFSPLEFLTAKAYELYAVEVNVYLYEAAIIKMANMPKNELKSFLEKYGEIPNVRSAGTGGPTYAEKFEKKVRWTLIYRDRFLKNWQKMDKDSMKSAIQFLNAVELLLPFEHFVRLAGGEDNIFVFGQLRAFRDGDENGDRPIMANTIGQFGSEQVRGPLAEIQNQMGISRGELFIHWLLEDL